MKLTLHVAALLTASSAAYFAWTSDVHAQPPQGKGKQTGSAGTESGWARGNPGKLLYRPAG